MECQKNYLEPTKTSMYKWLFQLNDSKSFHRKWLSNQTSIFNWLFRVPGTYYYQNDGLKPEPSGTTSTQKRCILKMSSSRQSKKSMLTLSVFKPIYEEKLEKTKTGFKNTNLTATTTTTVPFSKKKKTLPLGVEVVSLLWKPLPIPESSKTSPPPR